MPDPPPTPPERQDTDRVDAGRIALETARELGPRVTIVLGAALVLPVLGSIALFGFAPRLAGPAEDAGLVGAAIYALAFALLTGCALMPTYALSGVAGYLFGAVAGSIAAVVGVTGGAAVGITLAGALAAGRVGEVLGRHPRAEFVRRALVDRSARDELLAIALLRLPPNSPFALTNVALAAARTRIVPTLIATCLGMAPRTILAAILGAGVRAAGEAIDEARGAPRWVMIAGVIVAIVVFVGLYKLFGRWIADAVRTNLDDPNTAPTPQGTTEQPPDADRSV
ncbi:MAG: VTT domain-containing protein [Planctomycetota bacterium]